MTPDDVKLLALTRTFADLDLLMAEARVLGARYAGRGIASADHPLVTPDPSTRRIP